MDNTQIKVDEPRMDECEAYRIVLLDGERNKVKQSGETGVRIVKLGGPENIYVRKEPGKVSAPDTPIATVSQKTESKGPASSDAGRQARGVRVIGFGGKASRTPSGEYQASDKEAEKADEEYEGGKAAFGRKSKRKQSDSKVQEEKRLGRDLNNSIAEGSFTTSSSNIIGNYSTPFALALGATNPEIGLLNSVQNLAGILSQIPGAMLTKRMTRKRIWVMSTVLSRLLLLPIIFIGLFVAPSVEIWIVIALLGMVSFFSTMRGPAWSSMMGDIVPAERRGSYFGKRNMVINFAGMMTTLAAGIAVFYWGFPIIFAIAVVLTTLSIVFFVRMREPEMTHANSYHYKAHFQPRDLVYQIKTNKGFALFTVYMTVVNFGVNVAAPFAAVYMLKNLDIGYGWFAIVVTAGTLTYLLSTRYWGSKCDSFGNRKMLVISGILMCFVPLGYMLSTNVWEILIVKIYDGFVWGGFDLVVFNYLLAVTPSDKRPGFVANHNFMTGIGTVIGALFGAILVEDFQTGGFLMLSGLQLVFAVSVILRLSSVVFLPKIAEVETKERAPLGFVFWQTVAVGPARGMEHAISGAFRYPYGVKIKSKLGLNNSRKIKISTRGFGPECSGKSR